MFAKTIVLSDAFLDMPMTARCLYFTLGMLADDDGFVNAPKSIMRQCGATQDDILILIQKRYVLAFESGVIVIKHWRINNYLQNDRKKPTTYKEELAMLEFDEKNAYVERDKKQLAPDVYTEDVYTEDVYIDKDSIGKSRVEGSSISNEIECPSDDADGRVVQAWNDAGLTPISRLVRGSKREVMLKARIREFGVD